MSKEGLILVVDDDERICNLLVRYLGREGYKMESVNTGKAMRDYITSHKPDLVILDLVLPDDDGMDLARELRNKINPGIIMLTGKGETIERIVGLESGADDYITKPFDNRELLARVRSVLRRVQNNKDDNSSTDISEQIAFFDGWKFDLTAYDLFSPEGESVILTSYEYQLLSILVLSSNRVLSRNLIMNKISGRDWNPDDRSIDVLIGKLRKKLEACTGTPAPIKTIRGAGYKFTSKVSFEKM